MASEGPESVGLRPGGRSARVQAAVHRAVRELQEASTEPTVPAVADLAGVTPSTIYRRWGTLAQLLSDVAVERLRPETPPADTGSFVGDLTLWLDQYIEEISSAPGRAMIRDVLGGTPENACQCAAYTTSHWEVMRARAIARGEAVPRVDRLLEGVIAPVLYRLLFTATPATPEDGRRFLAATLRTGD